MKDINYEDYIVELLENDTEKKILKLIIEGKNYDEILEILLNERN